MNKRNQMIYKCFLKTNISKEKFYIEGEDKHYDFNKKIRKTGKRNERQK